MPYQIIVALDNQGNVLLPPSCKTVLGLLPGMIITVEEGLHGELVLKKISDTQINISRSADPEAYRSMKIWMEEPDNSGEEWWKMFEKKIQSNNSDK